MITTRTLFFIAMSGNDVKPHNALIVGATSSLAQSLCHSLAQRGSNLVLAGRDEVELDILMRDLTVRYGITCRKIAVDFLNSHFSAEGLIEKSGTVDQLFVLAGDMGTKDPSVVHNLAFTMHLNYTIPAQLITVCAQQMADTYKTTKQKSTIVIVTSVAGDRGRQSNYAYGAAKGALSTFASGLRNKFFKRGVHVLTVKPGFVDTPMTWGMDSPLIASREKVVRDILKAVDKKKDVIYTPFFWRYIMLIIMHIPEKIFKRMSL